jgi:Fe-S cluster assembly protein SufD
VIDSYLRSFEAFSRNGGAAGGAPEWARTLRLSGITRFESLGFPTTRNEDWHFTSVAPITERAFAPLTASPGAGQVTKARLKAFAFSDAWHQIVFVNGRYDASLSSLAALPDGVRVLPLAQAYDELPILVEQHLGRIASFDGESFTALNTAFIHDGAVVHVKADIEVAKPIHLLFVSDASAADGAAQPRNLIVLDRFAKATVIESYAGLDDSRYFTNAVTEAMIADGATLTHLKLQRESANAYHVGSLDVRQARESHLVSFSFATGAALSRTNIYTQLRGEGCGATLNGLYLGDGDQTIDHQTRIEHVEPNCYSRELYKGILDGSSHGVFNGKVYVHPAAQKTDGKQTNNTLLLSAKAQIDTKPQLEIFADDVKCTHGATVGRLDENSLFYMKSRGINARTARELLTYAFAADVLETIECAEVREGLEEATLRRYTASV